MRGAGRCVCVEFVCSFFFHGVGNRDRISLMRTCILSEHGAELIFLIMTCSHLNVHAIGTELDFGH